MPFKLELHNAIYQLLFYSNLFVSDRFQVHTMRKENYNCSFYACLMCLAFHILYCMARIFLHINQCKASVIYFALEYNNKTNDLILNLTPENVTQHSRIVTTTRKGSSTPTKMSKIIGRQIH